MPVVRLFGTGITTSSLGYGCASLMARVSRRTSVRLLGAAFDAGITHFDVARLYGYGEAERALGDFVQRRRDRVTIATKFGIFPPKRTPLLGVAKGAARALVAVNPRMRAIVRARAAQMTTRGRFDVASARVSLEMSLRELRTDYVDLLLLHDCRPEDFDNADQLLAFLESYMAQGVVRAFGVATDPDSVEYIVGEQPAFARVVQFPNDVINRNIERFEPQSACVTHSSVGEAVRRIRAHLASSRSIAAAWSERTGADLRDARTLGRFMLAAAQQANPRGVVLFSSLKERTIQANGELTAAGGPSGDQVRAFLDMVSVARSALSEIGCERP